MSRFRSRRKATCSIQKPLLSRNVERFRGGPVFKAHRLLYHSTLGSKLMVKKKRPARGLPEEHAVFPRVREARQRDRRDLPLPAEEHRRSHQHARQVFDVSPAVPPAYVLAWQAGAEEAKPQSSTLVKTRISPLSSGSDTLGTGTHLSYYTKRHIHIQKELAAWHG